MLLQPSLEARLAHKLGLVACARGLERVSREEMTHGALPALGAARSVDGGRERVPVVPLLGFGRLGCGFGGLLGHGVRRSM